MTSALLEQKATSPGLELRPLGPALGAEITGFDVDALESPALGSFLHRAVLDHQLLLLRRLTLAPASFHRLAASLGPLRDVPESWHSEPGWPGVQRLTNLGANGAPIGVNPDPCALHWHTDGSAARVPARFTLLYAVRIPSYGGETGFANMYAACAALSSARRRALAGRLAIHDITLARYFRHGHPIVPAGTTLRRSLGMRIRFVRRMLSRRSTRHPVIRVHEETGRSSLYLGDHAWRVTRCWWPAGARLVNELNELATTHREWMYMHHWQVGDLLVWDNRCLLHRGSNYDAAHEERIMLRAVVVGAGATTAV